MIARGRVRTEIGADFAGDSDAARGDQLTAMPPSTHRSSAEEAVKTHSGSG